MPRAINQASIVNFLFCDFLTFTRYIIDERFQEWMNFTKELYDAIEQQVKESRVDNFTDLTQTERSLFMDRACKALENSTKYFLYI